MTICNAVQKYILLVYTRHHDEILCCRDFKRFIDHRLKALLRIKIFYIKIVVNKNAKFKINIQIKTQIKLQVYRLNIVIIDNNKKYLLKLELPIKIN